MRTIVIANQKGGTGKTTVAATLAYGLAIYGSRILAIDLDPQGQLARLFREPHEDAKPRSWINAAAWLTGTTSLANASTIVTNNLGLIAGGSATEHAVESLLHTHNGSLPADLIAHLLAPARRACDYIVIDTSPTASQLQACALWAADLAIVPVLCDPLSVDGLDQQIHTLAALGDHAPAVLIQPNLYDPRRRLDHTILHQLHEDYGALVRPAIHVDAEIGRAALAGKTVYQTKQAGNAAGQFDTLCWAVKHA